MIHFNHGNIKNAALHFVGNNLAEEGLQLSDEGFVPDMETESLLWQHLAKVFKGINYQYLKENSVVLKEAVSVFEDSGNFLDSSKKLADYLYRTSSHPQIKGGELLLLELEDLVIEDKEVKALAILKIENKQSFFFSDWAENQGELHSYKGIATGKVDKACLVLDYERNSGCYVLAEDLTSSGEVAHFWKEEFLQAEARKTDYNQTENFLNQTVDFIENNLFEEESNPLQKMDYLQKTANYLNEHEELEPDDFGLTVFEDAAVADRFRAYTSVNMPDDEPIQISEEALKKQKGAFKSVLKLDKNFHIYIHGNHELIERGEEEGRKFYKIYFDEES